jgi:hypothetical protein
MLSSHTENTARANEKRLNTEKKRLEDESSSATNSFKEILDQQEMEYEDELRQLIRSDCFNYSLIFHS